MTAPSPEPEEPSAATTSMSPAGAIALAFGDDHKARTQQSRLARNVIIVLATQIIVWIAGAGLAILLPRYLSSQDVGRITFAGSFTSIFTLFVLFGSERFLTREVARSPQVASHLAFNALITRIPLYAVALALIAAFLIVFDYPKSTIQVVGLFSFSMLITSIGNTFTSVFQGRERMGPAAAAAIFEKVLSGFLGLAAVVLAGMGMVAYAGILVGANLLSVIIIGTVFMRSVGLSWRFEPKLCRAIIRNSLPFLAWGLSLYVYGSIDITILSVMADDSVVAWYGTAYRFVGIATFFPFALTTALLPNIAAMKAEESRPIVQRCFDIVAFVSIPIAIFFIIGAQSIVDFLGYPEEYDRTATLLRILAVQIPIVAFTMICGTLLIASNREGPRTIAALVAAFMSPVLNVVLIPIFQARYDNGAIGSAIATLIVEGFITLVVIRLLEPHTYGWANGKTALRCVAAGIPMGGVMYLALPYSLPVVMAGGAITYLVAALATRAITIRELLDLPKLVLGSRGGRQGPTDAESMNLSPSQP